MPSLIINCKEIKSDLSKRKVKPLGCRILYFIGWYGREPLLSIRLRNPDARGQLSAPLGPTAFYTGLYLAPQSLRGALEEQKNLCVIQIAFWI